MEWEGGMELSPVLVKLWLPNPGRDSCTASPLYQRPGATPPAALRKSHRGGPPGPDAYNHPAGELMDLLQTLHSCNANADRNLTSRS